MKKVIRNNVFETNSSSVHAFTVNKEKTFLEKKGIGEKNVIQVKFLDDEIGGYFDCQTFEEKLSFIYTFIAYAIYDEESLEIFLARRHILSSILKEHAMFPVYEDFYLKRNVEDDKCRYDVHRESGAELYYSNGYEVLENLPEFFESKEIVEKFLFDEDSSAFSESDCEDTVWERMKPELKTPIKVFK